MSIKILLADDSITIQKVIGIIFGGDDYTLTVVDNGKTAIEKARELSPDVLLIDALMPGMSGYEVCEVVRATPALAAKPILILTGSFEPFDEAKAKSCGADDFLAKPFESQQIVNKVKDLYELGISRSTSLPPAIPAPEPQPAVIPPVIPQETLNIAKPVMQGQTEDIWSAFTILDEPAPAVPSSPQATETALEPDVFSIISEEPDLQIKQTPATSIEPAFHTGSQWVPTDEHTFDFVEESVAEIPASVFTSQADPVTEFAFGDISFEEVPLQTSKPSVPPVNETYFDEPESNVFTGSAPPLTETNFTGSFEPVESVPIEPAFIAAPISSYTEPTADKIAQPTGNEVFATLTEEQLKAAIAGVSQEVIQRIVWEVVPDLAETLIKEAIRKIKEEL